MNFHSPLTTWPLFLFPDPKPLEPVTHLYDPTSRLLANTLALPFKPQCPRHPTKKNTFSKKERKNKDTNFSVLLSITWDFHCKDQVLVLKLNLVLGVKSF